MLASELVRRLHDLIEEHGDLQVMTDSEEELDFEYNDEDGEPAFIAVI